MPMTMRSRASSLRLLLLAAGCTYRARPSVRPAFDIPASFEERVPGAPDARGSFPGARGDYGCTAASPMPGSPVAGRSGRGRSR